MILIYHEKLTIIEILTRKITDMQKNSHENIGIIFFTQIINILH